MAEFAENRRICCQIVAAALTAAGSKGRDLGFPLPSDEIRVFGQRKIVKVEIS
jgi:hypothetical protein